MKPVKSSMITHVGYNPETQIMRLRFSSGDEYDHKGVSAGDHARFVGADSIGSHFAKHIRPRFKSAKVEKK